MFNINDIKDPPRKDRSVTFRMPQEKYEKLQRIDANVSTVLRYIIEVFLEEQVNQKDRFQQWTKSK